MKSHSKYQTPICVGVNLNIRPTYITAVPAWEGGNRSRSYKQRENEKNLKDNSTHGIVSDKSSKKIKNAVNWLYSAAKLKPVYDEKKEKYFWFKVNFITLTVPSQAEKPVPSSEVKPLFNKWLDMARKYNGLKNYVWKFESNKNGDLHIHLTTDTFIHYEKIKTRWNKYLSDANLLEDFRNRYKECTLEKYISMQPSKYPREQWQYERAWKRGVANNWQQPPTTDVHAVHKVNDVAAYICKYMSKDADLVKDFKGRIWGCNYHISEANSCKVQITNDALSQNLRYLQSGIVRWQPLMTKATDLKPEKQFGEIYYMKKEHWNKLKSTLIWDTYKKHKDAIRKNAAVMPKEYYTLFDAQSEMPVKTVISEPPKIYLQFPTFTELELNYS